MKCTYIPFCFTSKKHFNQGISLHLQKYVIIDFELWVSGFEFRTIEGYDKIEAYFYGSVRQFIPKHLIGKLVPLV